MLSAAKSARARSVIASSIAGFGRLGEHRPRAPYNRVPRLADKPLASALPQSGMGFPNIPGVVIKIMLVA
jgi:hypothetical protein